MSVAATSKSRTTVMEHLTRELLESYLGDERARRIARRYLPRARQSPEFCKACSI